MNKWLMWGVAAGMTMGAGAWAAEGQSPFHVENSLKLGYDDNVTLASDDKLDSAYLQNQITLTFDKTYENGFLQLRYDPSLTWYEDLGSRSEADWTHAASIIWNHQLSRRVGFTLNDSFMYLDRSDVVDADGTIRQANHTYTYNTASAALNLVLTPKSRLMVTGRNQIMRYDQDLIGNRDNYDIWAGGLSLGTQVGKKTTVFVDSGYEDMNYDGAGTAQEVFVPGTAGSVIGEVPDRGAQTVTVGLGVETIVSPNLMGRVRAGYMNKEFDAANTSSDDSPYGEVTVVIAPVPTTRLTLGASFSLYQSGLVTFSSQERATLSANLAQDLTSKITLSLIGQYYVSDYNADSSVAIVDAATVEDGGETAITLGARVSYRINRNNYVDAGYSFTKFDSDYAGRVDAERNRFDLGWRIKI